MPTPTTEPAAPSAADAAFARESARLLAPCLTTTGEAVRLRLDEPNAPHEAAIIPAAAFQLLMKILDEMASGHSVHVVPGQAEVGTREIADLLNCSRPHAIKLLDEGQIPSHRVGTHRRARIKDVLDYREEHYQARKAILDHMSAIDQELGLV